MPPGAVGCVDVTAADWQDGAQSSCRGVPVTSRFVHSAFFEQVSRGSFHATEATSGPWSPKAQHGGPPSALAVRDMERHEPNELMRLARVAVDILRPIPVDVLTVRTRTLRPGRRVALLETVVEARGQDVLYARGWRIGRSEGLPVIAPNAGVPGIPDDAAPPMFPGGHMDGYLAAIDWRFLTGGFAESGPGKAWSRPRIPLIDGELLTPMTRTMLLADSGSGVGMTLDPSRFQFLNVDLTVVLQRDPIGEWLLLDAITTMGGQGTGMTETQLSDRDGVIGTGLQTQLVVPVAPV